MKSYNRIGFCDFSKGGFGTAISGPESLFLGKNRQKDGIFVTKAADLD